MSIRIYALAKKLNTDSKDILDAVKQLGIEEKGTALAILSPEEAEQVKKSFGTRKAKTAIPAVTQQPATPQRPVVSTETRVRNLDAAKQAAKKQEAAEQPKEEPVEPKIKTKPAEPIAELKPEPVVVKLKVEIPVKDVQAKKPAPTKPVVIETGKTEPVTKPVEIEPKKIPKPKTLPQPIQPVKLEAPVLPPALGIVDKSLLVSGRQQRRKDKKERNKKEQAKKEGGGQGQHKQRPPLPPAAPIATGYSQPGHAANTRRTGYQSPMRRITDKIPSLDNNRPREGERKSGGLQPVSPNRNIRLAPVPNTPQNLTRKKHEPAAMKPDAALPPELLQGGKNVADLVAAHIKKHEERHRLKDDARNRDKAKVGGIKIKGKDDKRRSTVDVNAVFEANKKKRRNISRNNRDFDEDGNYTPRQLKRNRVRGKSAVNTAAPRKTDIVIQLPCTIKQFAEASGASVASVLRKMLEMGTMANINTQLERETAELLITAFDLQAEVRDQVTLEEQLVSSVLEEVDEPSLLRPRPPVVTVLGHVDHGKTTLLDYILHLNVADGEKGGITQHIRAYRVRMDNGQDITFVDTPGHEAFTEMRARGANCTDIVILVVAADDGVMPQTEEAISHAKAAGVPIVVALNKMDLPGMNPDRVIQELAQHDLVPSEWGGDTEVIRCSALTGMGVDKLLETVQLIAEMNELKANPNRKASGMTLEATLEQGQGVIAKVLVQNGTLRNGDVILCGTAYGRVRAMYDTLQTDKLIEVADPSTPVNLVGLDVAPAAGSSFIVLDGISDARRIAEVRMEEERKAELADVQGHVTLESLFQRMLQSRTVQTLNVIIRADVRGSIEAIRKELGKLDHPEVKIKILQATVGGVTEGDVQLAAASDAIIVGFSVVPDENARMLAEQKKVQIRRYDIIYNLTDDIRKALEGMLKPVEQVKELGRAQVQRVFSISHVGTIAGCRVMSGTIERDCKMRIIRDSRIVGEYPMDSLKREKDDVKEIREGYECGIKLKGFNDLKEGDFLEAYKIEEVARTF